ncbi:hypothetical protein [Flavobacterium marginilacus]|uniref:hypothetical protein n=1 Tax=Flavobacterium marginilacus TaxID=3003256 RepID=UPI00248E5E7E|nr:hypothetical protein [Flavobacterium marginilacus]
MIIARNTHILYKQFKFSFSSNLNQEEEWHKSRFDMKFNFNMENKHSLKAAKEENLL